MRTKFVSLRRSALLGVATAGVVLGLVVGLGCGGGRDAGPEGGGAQGQGEGPGHRTQYLGLTADQELSLGRQAYQEVLQKNRAKIVTRGENAEKVKRVGEKIVRASEIKPLQREINLHFDERKMEWVFTLIDEKQVNAFCLPGGKVAVFSGLFDVATTEDELAAVMGHEIGHALAHHSSERIYREGRSWTALKGANFNFDSLSVEQRDHMSGLMAAGSSFSGLAYERQQESEADHIGLFLMTFAGYNPDECVKLWQGMADRSGPGKLPEIFSDHPSDAHRIAQMKAWVPQAKAGLQAFNSGHVVK